MKVLYLTNIPSPYRVNYFNELGKQCELTVLFETDASTERDASWKSYQFLNFEGIILPGKRTSLDTAFCPTVLKYLKRGQYDHIIVTVLASLTGLLAAAWMRSLNIPYLYEGDGGVAHSTKGLKAAIKRFIISPAKLCFSTSAVFDQYCMAYGASKENIRRYPFSSIYEKDILDRLPDSSYKATLRKLLAISEDHFIISVGRIVHLKGYDVLLRAFASAKNPAWGLYIIGGSINEEFQEIITKEGIENVHFLDFKLPDELKKYYMAADIFVLPTRFDPWGLVINEAMAAGLPVITTYACGAGTEMVKQDKNGYLYEPESIQTLQAHLCTLMESEKLRRQFGENALQVARTYTIEKMTEAHYNVLMEETIRGRKSRK